MSRYLDPKADVVFKKIFGDHPKLLISFLNALLPLPDNGPIVSLTYLQNEQVPLIPEFKRTIADVKCTDAQGRVFIVEMQMNWTDQFKQRLLFGTSQAFVKQLKTGEDYTFLQPVYGLGLVADIYEKQSNDWYHHYQLVKKGNATHDVIEHLQLIFIELPKFPIQSPEEKQLRLLWLRFLREVDEKTKSVSQDLLDVPEIAEALGLAEESAYTPGELSLYESYWDQVSREKTLLSGNYAKGLAEGEAKGKAEGEELATHRIAINMLTQGVSIEIVVRSTGLTREDVEKIQAKIDKS
ncbi:MAG: Rpn family recombination-promoting nuclease/putative transposase [Legionella sp.]|nr:Rpn family recombination-promoting nuclease/putative transposase [Legionella sp.]